MCVRFSGWDVIVVNSMVSDMQGRCLLRRVGVGAFLAFVLMRSTVPGLHCNVICSWFGHDMGCLENSVMHTWLDSIEMTVSLQTRPKASNAMYLALYGVRIRWPLRRR